MWHILRKEEWNTGFCWRNLGERGHLENLSLDERIILKRVFTKLDEGSIDWIDLSLCLGTSGGVL